MLRYAIVFFRLITYVASLCNVALSSMSVFLIVNLIYVDSLCFLIGYDYYILQSICRK